MALSSGEGLTSLQHFIGVVEDRNDPLNIGRVRVRCFGVHTDNKSDIPTDALPWAMPVMPYHSASISGIGQSPTGPVEGSWVFGLFIDGQEMQQPIVLGTMVGIPKEKIASTKGFSDPLGIYPKEKYMRQSDVNKLARGETAYGEETLAVKVRDRTTAVPTAVPPTVASVRDLEGPVKPANTYINKGQSGDFYYRNRWNEPNPRYGGSTSPDGAHETCFTDDSEKTQPWQQRKPGTSPNRSLYPFNHTYTTESGHVMEYDDTPGGERIHQYHTKGTFYEIQPDGTKVTKVVGDDYQIYLKGNHVVVEGNMNLTVKEKQEILSIIDIQERAIACLKFMNTEYQKLALKNDIQSRVRNDLDQQQREYYLNQQMKTIQEELGGVSYEEEVEEMRNKAKNKKWNIDVKNHFDKELIKMQRMNPQVAEYSIQRNYLDLFL